MAEAAIEGEESREGDPVGAEEASLKTIGNAKRGGIEARYKVVEYPNRPRETVLDEVVAANAHVHLEAMGRNEFALIIETQRERACFRIGSKRADVDVSEQWREKQSTSPLRQRRRA